MTGLEITLLIVGAAIAAVSFIFSSKADGNSGETTARGGELTEKQKEDMKKQIMDILDEQMEEVKDRTEVSLDKLSNEKMLEMNEYSETILSEINRNHNEVMFLYDMLNEKKKEINITVRDMNIAKKEIEKNIAVKNEPAAAIEPEDIGFMAGEEIIKEEKASSSRARKNKILDQLDAVADAVTDEVKADEAAKEKKPRKKTDTGKTAASRARATVKKETVREDNKDPKAFETGNNNEKILELNAKGKSNVEIAKELGLGIGEVKLVIDLFRGGR